MEFLKRFAFSAKMYWDGLFLGLSAADKLMTNTSPYISQMYGIIIPAYANTLAAQLLRGELTQQVKQLRYSIYKVNEEADRYHYVGNGICVKQDAKTRNKPVITQDQREIDLNSVEASNLLTDVSDNGIRDYLGRKAKKVINIHFTSRPTLGYQNNIVKIKLRKNEHHAILYMSTAIGTTRASKRVADALIASYETYNKMTDYFKKNAFLKKNDFLGNIDSIDIETYRCEGEYDGNLYKITGCYVENIRPDVDDKHCLAVEINYHKLTIDKMFTIDQVFDQTQQDLYDQKAQKADTCIEYADALYAQYKEQHKEDEFDFEKFKALKLDSINFEYDFCKK